MYCQQSHYIEVLRSKILINVYKSIMYLALSYCQVSNWYNGLNQMINSYDFNNLFLKIEGPTLYLYLFFPVIVIVISAMFTCLFCPKLQHKCRREHCDYDRKNQIHSPSCLLLHSSPSSFSHSDPDPSSLCLNQNSSPRDFYIMTLTVSQGLFTNYIYKTRQVGVISNRLQWTTCVRPQSYLNFAKQNVASAATVSRHVKVVLHTQPKILADLVGAPVAHKRPAVMPEPRGGGGEWVHCPPPPNIWQIS